MLTWDFESVKGDLFCSKFAPRDTKEYRPSDGQVLH